MITVEPDVTINKKQLERLLNKFGKREYKFNIQSIDDDINQLSNLAATKREGVQKKNISNAIKYMENVKAKAGKSGVINIIWSLNDNKITALPVEFRKFAEYNIQLTDYIVKEETSVICINYEKLIDIIVFELVHEAIGFSMEKMENELENVGIVAVYNSSYIEKLIPDMILYKALITRAVESQYVNIAKGKMFTYFCEERKLTSTYKDIVEHSINTVMSIVCQNILEGVDRKFDCKDVKLVSVFNDSIHLVVDSRVVNNAMEIVAESVSVKALGRKFQVKPIIEIY